MTIKELIVPVNPKWKLVQLIDPHTAAFRAETKQVLISIWTYDSQEWIHLSVVGRTGKNSWYTVTADTLREVKEDFLGDRFAYQVFPCKGEYVNVHQNVLHLYAKVGGERVTPDFRIEGMI